MENMTYWNENESKTESLRETESTKPEQPACKSKKPRKKRTAVLAKRIALCLLSLLCSVLIFAFAGMAIICYGPSEAARDLFVVSVMETSAAKFLAHLYFSEEEVEAILANNAVKETQEITDEALVTIPQPEDAQALDLNGLEIVDVKGNTFKGKMMIVNDPSRVYVATPPRFGANVAGMRVSEMVERDGAIAGVNAGGFADEGGMGLGGQPLGIVIKESELVYGSPSTSSTVIGFDEENRLIVGQMTGEQALERRLRDAVSFGPVLVVNGEPAEVNGTGGGLNPRTAIGQRKDGAVLILVVDGRQAHSIGATYNDLVDVMLQFGAINAANLDGGSSSLMIYENEIITTCASLYGPRKLPTAILVK